MKKNSSKLIIAGVVAMFLLLALAPSTNAVEIKNKNILKKVEVIDYKADGTKELRTIFFTDFEIKELKDKLLNSETLEERLGVLKEFKIISKDQTVEDWFEGMQEKAANLGIKNTNYLTRTKIRLPIMISAFNKVNAVSIGSTSTRLGFSPIIKIVEKLIKLDLPRADILDLSSGLINVLDVKNPLAKHFIISTFGFSGHVGFVGTAVKLPFLLNIYSGYSALSIHFGLGLHLKDNYLPSL